MKIAGISLLLAAIGGASAFAPPKASFSRVFRIQNEAQPLVAIGNPKNPPLGLSDTKLSALGGSDVDSLTSNPLFSSFVDAITEAVGDSSKPTMAQYFMQAVIDSAVPSLFIIITLGFAAFFFKKSRDGGDDNFRDSSNPVEELYNDLYGNAGSKKLNFGSPFGRPNRSSVRNLGIPSTEYIKVTSLNEKYASYDFSLAKATTSKAAAAAKYRSKAFDRALEMAVQVGEDLPAYAKSQLLDAEKEFVKEGKKIVGTIQILEAQLIKERVDGEMKKMGMEDLNVDPKPMDAESNETTIVASSSSSSSKANTKYMAEIAKLQKELKELELTFIQDSVAALGPERAVGLRAALLGDVAARGTGGLLTQLQDRPLSSLLRGSQDEKKSLFVMKFPGDVTASQLNELREEVTAIIRNAKPGDEALVILQSGGGTVTGYGLAAGQLVRLRENGTFLTVAVEQVAASGGYMMTCVADRIIASPFAVLGSIGVISEIPNAYERLNREGIEFQTVTAGEFKRTLTPTKKINKEDVKKAKQDVEGILTQFSGFVQKNRPGLDVASVATGETWFGEAAVAIGLCDEIKPVDDVLLKYVDLGYNVYEIAYRPPPAVPQGVLGLLPATQGSENQPMGRRVIRWLVNVVTEEVKAAIFDDSAEKRYMAKDDIADTMQIKD